MGWPTRRSISRPSCSTTVAPLLAAAGYRVIMPHLRGHGTTRFRSSETFQNGQQSVIALDIVALMDAPDRLQQIPA
jgi:pimeloyl-ACP methyl ester carboxylesterase